jgi:hypothetical protein
VLGEQHDVHWKPFWPRVRCYFTSTLLFLELLTCRLLISPPEGLSVSEASTPLRVLLKDSRVRIIEISGYATLRGLNKNYINLLVDLLVEGQKG